MKKLESVTMIQYFLYERTELEFGDNTAFLGPNGTGKTALLDAFQIVMLGADGNRTHFNASGEGKKRARSLRDYCLGVYGQTDSERFRRASNTYINLVFRDQLTGVPVTAGVSMAAHEDNPDVIVNSLYILPGVALDSRMHVEREGEREVVIPWRRFQHVIADECRNAGTIAITTTNREEFSRQLYVGNLASPGERPNTKAIRNAFARSLKLNQDVPDLSLVLSENLIEQRNTDVLRFKTRLLQFRQVRELIKLVKERIERITVVAGKYAVVEKERIASANLDGLNAVYETERIAADLADTQERVEQLTQDLQSKQSALEMAQAEAKLAEAKRDRAIEARNRDPDYAKQAGAVDRLNDFESAGQSKAQAVRELVASAISALGQAAKIPTLQDDLASLQLAHELVHALPTADLTQSVSQEQLREVASALEKAAGRVGRVRGQAEAADRSAQESLRQAQSAMERAKQGLRDVRAPVGRLQRLLADGGISAVPVSDLVTVKEDIWQPAIEAYLGNQKDALLVLGGDEQERAAIGLFRKNGRRLGLYGVRLALPSRCRPWQPRSAGRFAASLIEGDRDAVQYLQAALGQLTLAETDEELHKAARAISKEGMVSAGGGVELRQLPDVLAIGRSDAALLQEDAARALTAAERHAADARQTVVLLAQAATRLATYADPDALVVRLIELFKDARDAQLTAVQMRHQLAALRSGHLDALEQELLKASEHRDQANRTVASLNTALGQLMAKLEEGDRALAAFTKALELAQSEERSLRTHPLYDANEVERHRARYDERFGDDTAAKQQACRERARRAGNTATEADHEAWGAFAQYLVDFSLQNTDLSKPLWQRVYRFVLEEKSRLESLELVEREQEAEAAYAAAVKVFRTDVAQVLLEGFEAIGEQIDGLNGILKSAPEFSNAERYQFKHTPREEHRALYDFLRRIREADADDLDLFDATAAVPEEFRQLIEGDADSGLLHQTSPLNDHRRFFSYDVQIFRNGAFIGWLSKRFGPGSGGEHRTPLYVIFGAALAAAYGKSKNARTPGGIILLDEAFEKMDAQNVRATAEYLNALGLQMILAGPESDQPKMSSFLDIYYDMARHGSNRISLTRNVVHEDARELLRSDNYLLKPELLTQRMAAIAAEDADAR